MVSTALEESHGRYFGAKARGAGVGNHQWRSFIAEMAGYGVSRMGQIEAWVVGVRSVFVEQGHIAFGGGKDEDRKSTRLNSSHANISYAVFCLKKKKRHLWST